MSIRLRMSSESNSRIDLYQDYRAEVEGERTTRSLRVGVAFVGIASSCFIPLDYIAFPDSFGWMLAFRLFCNGVMGLIYFRTARTRPMSSAVVGCLVTGLMLLAVIGSAGGITSDYAPGLMLLFLGMPVLLPFSTNQISFIVAVLLAGLGSLALVSNETVTVQSYLTHLIFPAAAGFEAVVATALLDRLRFADYRQRQELEELDREKSRFTANIHHELRTPLTLTLAPIEAMIGGEFGAVSDLQRGYLETMRSNGLRLLNLINNLLDLAKIEGSQLEIKRRPVRLRELVEGLVNGARPLAERKGIVLELTGFEGSPVLNVDAEALEKVIVNLIGNSLKFTEGGGEIEVRGEPEEGGGIHLVVADTGLGIPPDQLDRIFDRFAQVDASSTRKHEGTGIGLALVQELVQLHDGRIWAESEGFGHGAQMHVVLPQGEADTDEACDEAVLQMSEGSAVALGDSLAAMQSEIGDGRDDDPRMVELERSVQRSEGTAAGVSTDGPVLSMAPADAPEVLICEDNVDMRRLLRFLVGQEFRVRVASNGREGVEQLCESLPDLILTDVMMPEMSGTELCRIVKENPETASIPVVIVTSKAEREMKIEGLELGADDYVTKPFHPRELMARVRALVRLHRLQKELAIRNTLLESTNEELSSTLDQLKEAGAQLVQAERLAAVGELAAGIAHEVNNPVNFATNALTTLQSYVADVQRVVGEISGLDRRDPARLEARLDKLEALQGELDFDELSNALAELVGIVTEGLQRTQRLVGDLRDFAAPGQGASANIDLRKGIQSTVALLNYALREAAVEVAVEVSPELPQVTGDTRALNQVFLNLLKNATEALEGVGGSISVSARPEGAYVVVRVRDDGPGIGPEEQDRLFEPFFSTKEAGRGTGLGLSISRRIVQEHEGSIDVESTPGEGTTFTVRLPIRGDGPGGERAA